MIGRGLARLLGLTPYDRVVQTRVLPVDLPLLGLAVIQVVHAGKDRPQQQIRQRLQRVHQHRIVRSLADRQMKGVVQMRVRRRICSRALRGHHFVIAAADHDEVRLRAANGRQPGRLGLQQ
ncbi:hypothetical protein D3C72_1803350 [compost metagenome]